MSAPPITALRLSASISYVYAFLITNPIDDPWRTCNSSGATE